MNLNEPFQKDKNGLFYIDSNDVSLTPFHFTEVKRSYASKRDFYFIDKVPNYIIKDTTNIPYLFNGIRTKMMLKKFMSKQDEIDEIDFPVGYYLENNKIKGTIIPYYEGAISVKQLTDIYGFDRLKEFYHHDNNEKINLIKLCLDILNLVEIMYYKDIIYLDLYAGNFLVYNNIVKVIDFEPNRIYFTKNKEKHLDLLLSNYSVLVDFIWRHYDFKDIFYNRGVDFTDTKRKVKALYSEKRG